MFGLAIIFGCIVGFALGLTGGGAVFLQFLYWFMDWQWVRAKRWGFP